MASILDCKDFIEDSHIKKRFVLLHHYCESGNNSIVAFSDNFFDLQRLKVIQPRYGSFCHSFFILPNNFSNPDLFEITDSAGELRSVDLFYIKDICLIDICKNVADYLADGEYAMLKKSYFKSATWFEKAKNSAAFGAEIIENY